MKPIAYSIRLKSASGNPNSSSALSLDRMEWKKASYANVPLKDDGVIWHQIWIIAYALKDHFAPCTLKSSFLKRKADLFYVNPVGGGSSRTLHCFHN